MNVRRTRGAPSSLSGQEVAVRPTEEMSSVDMETLLHVTWRDSFPQKSEATMNLRRTVSLLGSAAAGAAAMYLLDPQNGKRRMSLVRDQLLSASKWTGRKMQ